MFANIQDEMQTMQEKVNIDKGEVLDLLKLQKEKIGNFQTNVDYLYQSSTGISDTMICILEVLDIQQVLQNMPDEVVEMTQEDTRTDP